MALLAAGTLSQRRTPRRARGCSGVSTGTDQPVAVPSSSATFLNLHHEGQGPCFSLCCPRPAAVPVVSVGPVWACGMVPQWAFAERSPWCHQLLGHRHKPRAVSRMRHLHETHATSPRAPAEPPWHWQVTKMTCRVTVNREGM